MVVSLMLKYRNDKCGMSIIEILVAVMLLTIGVYGFYQHFIGLGSRSLHELGKIEATLLARQQVEQLRATPYETLRAWNPPGESKVIAGHVKYQYLTTLEPQADGSIEIHVVVGWNLDENNQFVPGRKVKAWGVRGP